MKHVPAKRKNSLLRAKKSTLSLSDIVLKEGAALVPGGTIIYELGKVLFDHGANYIKDRSDERLSEFHYVLLNEDNEENINKLIDTEFSIDDYHKVLSCCVNDIENEKTQAYASFFKHLILSDCSTIERRHFIKSISDFTFYDLELLRKIYMNQKYDLMLSRRGINEQLKEIANTEDKFELLTFKKLIESGLLSKDIDLDYEEKEETVSLTDLGIKFVELVYTEKHLHPESIGIKPFRNIDLFIISYELSKKSKHAEYIDWLRKELWDRQVKSYSGTFPENKEVYWAHHYTGLLLLEGEKKFDQHIINKLLKVSTYLHIARINTHPKSKRTPIKDIKMLGDYDIDLINIVDAKKKTKVALDQLLD